MANANLTAAYLRERLHYDPETGLFTWRVTDRNVKAGHVAGTPHCRGYLAIAVGGIPCLAHRLAWLYVHGKWPAHQIDHINGIKTDNRIANLRDVSQSVNMQNVRKATSRSKSGVLGVSRAQWGGRWQAQLAINGKATYLGNYATEQLAHEAYLAAKRKHHEGCTI
jgi:hypothetical protein